MGWVGGLWRVGRDARRGVEADVAQKSGCWGIGKGGSGRSRSRLHLPPRSRPLWRQHDTCPLRCRGSSFFLFRCFFAERRGETARDHGTS